MFAPRLEFDARDPSRLAPAPAADPRPAHRGRDRRAPGGLRPHRAPRRRVARRRGRARRGGARAGGRLPARGRLPDAADRADRGRGGGALRRRHAGPGGRARPRRRAGRRPAEGARGAPVRAPGAGRAARRGSSTSTRAAGSGRRTACRTCPRSPRPSGAAAGCASATARGRASSGARSSRSGSCSRAGAWYLVAHRSAGMRVYRVSRVVSVRPLDEAFERPDGFELGWFWDEWSRAFEASLPRIEVTVRAPRRAVSPARPHVSPRNAVSASRTSARPTGAAALRAGRRGARAGGAARPGRRDGPRGGGPVRLPPCRRSRRTRVFLATGMVLLAIPGPAVLYVVTRSIEMGRAGGVSSVRASAPGRSCTSRSRRRGSRRSCSPRRPPSTR